MPNPANLEAKTRENDINQYDPNASPKYLIDYLNLCKASVIPEFLRSERHCLHFSVLPMGMRVFYSSILIVLGFAYLFATFHVFASHGWLVSHQALSGLCLGVMISGIFMILAFAAAVFIFLYQIWFYKLPSDISENGGHVS
jgi:uncharacterized membrane protein